MNDAGYRKLLAEGYKWEADRIAACWRCGGRNLKHGETEYRAVDVHGICRICDATLHIPPA